MSFHFIFSEVDFLQQLDPIVRFISVDEPESLLGPLQSCRIINSIFRIGIDPFFCQTGDLLFAVFNKRDVRLTVIQPIPGFLS